MAPSAVGGMFGPPQTVSRESGGLNTAIGYWYYEDTYKNDTNHPIRQHHVYSQVSYGSKNIWEIYGRIGVSDLKIFDASKSTHIYTTTIKDHFEENWRFVGTLGAKGFFAFNSSFGIGAFVQANSSFSNYTDNIVGIYHSTPFTDDFKIKNLWNVNLGIGAQATVPYGIKLYAGPFIYYAEADAQLACGIPGIQSGDQRIIWKNKSIAGGYFGADIPLARGFRLNIEGQYTDRFSIGSAITYTY